MVDQRLVRMVPVQSSNVRTVGYDDISRVLFVQFRGYQPKHGPDHPDSLYKYFYVPELVYLKFLASRSKGKFVHWFLKGKYRYIRIGRVGWRGPKKATQQRMKIEQAKPIRRKPKSEIEGKKDKKVSRKKPKKSVKSKGRRKKTRTRRKTTKKRG